MKKEEFKKGQTVWVYLIGNAARRVTEDNRIQEWEVKSVGRKYLTAGPKDGRGWDAKFSMEEDFCNVGEPCEDYKLFFTKEDLLAELEAESLRKQIRLFCQAFNKLERVPLEQLRTAWDALTVE
ncbi:hypothetical protein B5E64_05530 [Drancourtella sp. An12]|uniref:beta barrel domain-containing protein n=1 Tax=Drancourtella sp. An12 TaxID=1965548 RepID=UPI000B382E00|nr:hypothetical protein [Drancourtella sp. An12]OUQ46220.1 hypothetical protein B5E64_05530 [Drancourtella sp. An12]